jgi:hypothetical protein
MLARKELPENFIEWNTRWDAPFGKKAPPRPKRLFGGKSELDEFDKRGVFGFQGNNDTRTFEYPWAYYAAEAKPNSRILEIGGGMSGFQFTLALAGSKVVNVDP